mgnify:CR=1 FL=1
MYSFQKDLSKNSITMHFKGIVIATLKGLGEFQRWKAGIKELQMEKQQKNQATLAF